MQNRVRNRGFTSLEAIMLVGIGALIAGILIFTVNAPTKKTAFKPVNINAKQEQMNAMHSDRDSSTFAVEKNN
jgi:hypothetical protein